jgi:hypothetical protein
MAWHGMSWTNNQEPNTRNDNHEQKKPTNPKQTLSYVANLYPMKHITTFLLLGIPLFVSAQSLQLSGHVYWPNGGIMEYPMTLHVAYDGCPEENVEVDFVGGSFTSRSWA